ncbi:MAG: tRNA dihydrouridine synthase DusB [Candidatus Cloacimonadota bacterium]|nr:MAG: tRNA dihydrouridine synthase DusB [Candidatus Cloacimonadota bacterium]PCJ21008.1 MAG: tRNA dihydrouridine synthase DusB [Candidatus Cloacimonadota bacterium]
MNKKKVSKNMDGFVLGDIKIFPPVCSAPMAGYSNQATRVLYSKFSCPLNVTEMVSAKALIKKNKRTWDYISKSEQESLLWVQLFGGDPLELQEAVQLVQKEINISAIDLNLGCPVKKISKNLAGAQLMKSPEQVYKIIVSMTDGASVPITVKMRSGIDNEKNQALEIALACEEAGASLITIHPRSKEQKFTGSANWEIIKQLKEVLTIPLIGNGDVFTLRDYIEMVESTSCDGVMIGRGALGNPWIFQEIYNYHMKSVKFEKKAFAKIALEYFELELRYSKYVKNEYLRVRKSIHHYFKNSSNYFEIKENLQSASSNDELIKKLKGFILE